MSKYLCSRYNALEAYTPGEQPTDFSRFIKLNTNESPFPPTKGVLEALSSGEAERLNLYPPLDSPELRERLGKIYGVKPESVFLCNGSDEVLSFCFLAFCGESTPAAFADITYGFYKVYAQLYGTSTKIIPLRDDLSLCPEDYFNIGATVFIANPNAPTGLCISVEDIERIVRLNSENLVVIDEAYVDFGAQSAATLTLKYDNLLITGTFSKSRSLAGARLGYALGNPALISDLNKIRFSTNPYNINRMTYCAGLAAIKDNDQYMKQCACIIENRKSLVESLRGMGFSVTDSKANFIFAEHTEISGGELYEELKARGVLVRHFSQPRIDNYLRITIGTKEQNDVLVQKIDEIIKGRKS